MAPGLNLSCTTPGASLTWAVSVAACRSVAATPRALPRLATTAVRVMIDSVFLLILQLLCVKSGQPSGQRLDVKRHASCRIEPGQAAPGKLVGDRFLRVEKIRHFKTTGFAARTLRHQAFRGGVGQGPVKLLEQAHVAVGRVQERQGALAVQIVADAALRAVDACRFG